MRTVFRPRLIILAAFILAAPGSLIAQSIDFRVDNVTLEQTIATAQGSVAPMMMERQQAPTAGSSTVILQRGQNNSALTSITGSTDAFAGALQTGDNNSSIAAIIDSPRSKIAQVQVGDSNSSIIAIVGGSDNTAATAQIGSNHHARIGLQNSTGTTVIFGQAGRNTNGGIVIKNAPRGTVIRVD
ncbi:MAG: hypothetical protein AAGK92_12715 [Pseudomonadota bacterium]